ncbi:MAG: hypothetical protein ACXU9L_14720, partial [Thermodesulfobacteriota bacterium]
MSSFEDNDYHTKEWISVSIAGGSLSTRSSGCHAIAALKGVIKIFYQARGDPGSMLLRQLRPYKR